MIRSHQPPLYVTSLPSPAYDGQEVYYETGQSGVTWHLRYRTAVSKWEFVGGPPLVYKADGARTQTNVTAYANLVTDPISFALALPGDYDIEILGRLTSVSAAQGYLSYAVGGTVASDNWACTQTVSAALTGGDISRSRRHTNLAANSTIAEKARTGGNYAIIWSFRQLRVWPVRLG